MNPFVCAVIHELCHLAHKPLSCLFATFPEERTSAVEGEQRMGSNYKVGWMKALKNTDVGSKSYDSRPEYHTGKN